MLYIRTDMNDVIATGHVMRCLSIADAARRKGEEITFILADNNAFDLVVSRGHHVIVLNTPWDNMEKELELLEEIISINKIDKLFIDSYQVTYRYLEKISELVKTIYIDDLNKFFYPVNVVVCYVSYWKKFYCQKKYSKTNFLLGTKYTPVRAVFCGCKEKHIKKEIENLLILTGGTDAYNFILQLLEALELERYDNIDVICGKYYPDYEGLCNKYREQKNVIINKAVTDIERYMKKADMVITAGGTTLYEICAVGTPAISFSLADNQLENVLQFQKDGIIDYAGDVRYDNVVENVLEYLKFDSQERRKRQSREMQKLVDGYGADRIVEEWVNL